MESYNVVLIIKLWHCIHLYVAMEVCKVYARQHTKANALLRYVKFDYLNYLIHTHC